MVCRRSGATSFPNLDSQIHQRNLVRTRGAEAVVHRLSLCPDLVVGEVRFPLN